MKFETDLSAPLPGTAALPQPTGIAEVQINVRVVHNLTHRVIAETRLWAVGLGGSLPFGSTPGSVIPGRLDFQKTSMANALEHLTQRTHSYLKRILYPQPLDAQVFKVDPEKGVVSINVGRKHGVRVQDEFSIYHVALKYEDPLTEADLGDKWARMGVIRVQTVGAGFSRGVVLAGRDFFRGQVARASMPTPGAFPQREFSEETYPDAKTSGADIFPGTGEHSRLRTPFLDLAISPFFRFSLDY